jgi:hypothetical protein
MSRLAACICLVLLTVITTIVANPIGEWPDMVECCHLQRCADTATYKLAHQITVNKYCRDSDSHRLALESRDCMPGKWVLEYRTVHVGRFVAPRSPDLSTCDFYLWGYLKGKVYETNPHTLDELKENIRSAIEAIDVIVLRQVYLNMITRAQNVLILTVRISNTFCKSVHLVYNIKLSLQEFFFVLILYPSFIHAVRF